MCGIVGYIGHKNAQSILLSGLRRLEYRGYDSAGIVTFSNKNRSTILKKKGKVSQLDRLTADNQNNDTVGIGHTRWATHGEPSEVNAHPHQVGDIFLVHNGIIENYKDLRQVLEAKGYSFKSQTDSEVLAACIDSVYQTQKTKNLLVAITDALKVVIGAYGIAVMTIKNPQQIIAVRKGSPLILGVGEGEVLIASDVSALVAHTNQVIYLNDDEIAVCDVDGVQLFDVATNSISPTIEKLDIDIQAIQKKGYEHFLLKEINDQPETLRATLLGRIQVKEGLAKLGGPNMSDQQLRNIKNIIIVGCGTAHYAGLLASYYMEQFCDDITIQVVVASEYRYRSFNIPEGSVALFVSQSGETADTLACVKELKRRGVYSIGVVNVVGSTVAREVDGGIYLHVGAEISVASTKAFTSQVVAMILFGLTIAQAKGASSKELNMYIKELDALPSEIEKVIQTSGKKIKTIAKSYAAYDHAMYLGRDTAFPVALEGALKLKEISYIHADAYPAGELKHGAIALVDDRFFEVALIADNWLYEKTMSNITELHARGAHVFAITDSKKDIEAENIIRIDSKLSILTPLLFNVALQLFAYYLAVEKGTDVDQPRNLAKSVTVE